jgi:hypothetical protein
MKKLLLLSALLICSCSSDDSVEENNNTSFILPSVIKTTNTLSETNEFSYKLNYVGNTNKISEVRDNLTGEILSIFVYNEFNLISQVIDAEDNSSIYYQYDSQDRIISRVAENNNNGEDAITNIEYNNDGTAIMMFDNDPDTIEILTFDANNNIVEVNDIFEGTSELYTYDTKNYPYKNIAGFNNAFLSTGALPFGVKNNAISRNDGLQQDSAFYVYNEQDYPTIITSERWNDYQRLVEITYLD